MVKLHFSTTYLLASALLLTIEIAIAYFHFNPFIRGFIGDVLVILLLYSTVKIFIKNHSLTIALAVLGFAYLVEALQYLKLPEKLNIQGELLLTIVGSVYDVWDLVAYTIGFLLILLIEKISKNEYYKDHSI